MTYEARALLIGKRLSRRNGRYVAVERDAAERRHRFTLLNKIRAFFTGLGWALVIVSVVLFAVSCAGTQQPACQPGEAAKIEAAFIAELVAACDVEPEKLEQCPAFEPIRARYRTPRLDVLERCQ